MNVQYVDSEGYRIAYAVAGNRPDCVVIVPGWVSHIDHPMPQIEPFPVHLTELARIVTFDKRGSGASDRLAPGLVPTLEDRVIDLEAVLDEITADDVVLFGVSEGGPMALLYAALYPDRVRGLLLYGAYAKWSWDDFGLGSLADTPEQVADYLLRHWGTEQGAAFHIWQPEISKSEHARTEILQMLRAAATPSSAVSALQAAAEIDVTDVLPLINVPVVIVHRTDELAIPVRCARELAAAIPHARLVEVPGTDHSSVPWGVVATELERLLTGSVQSRPSVDRILSTVLFTDIAESTTTAASIGDAEWRDVLDWHDRVTVETVAAHGGLVVKHTGDGVLARFDGPGAAVRAAHTLIDVLRERGLSIRCGIHTGEIELRGADVSGLGVHIAARVSGLASGGEALTSRTVRDLTAGSGIIFDSVGTHELKGVPDRWEIFATSL